MFYYISNNSSLLICSPELFYLIVVNSLSWIKSWKLYTCKINRKNILHLKLVQLNSMTFLSKVASVRYYKRVELLENVLKTKDRIFATYQGMDVLQSEILKFIFQINFESYEYYFSQWYIYLKDSYIFVFTWEIIASTYMVWNI